MELLDDFITITEAARQLGKDPRTVRRMIERRELAVTYSGKTPLIHVPSSRDILMARIAKAVPERRGRR
jgi:excisionase family DNA binding protein